VRLWSNPNHFIEHLLAGMRPKRFPELILLHETENMPEGALCSLCGDPMSVPSTGFLSLREIEAFATAFKRHIELCHPEVAQDESSATH
jgi:hypothetical protein